MANKKVWRKALELGLDEKDARLLHVLSRKGNSATMISARLQRMRGLAFIEAKNRLAKLREKNILLKDRISVLDQIKIWDGYYIALIKAAIVPPVIGMGNKFPTGLEDRRLSGRIKEGRKRTKVEFNTPRLYPARYRMDILLIVSATSQDEFAEFLSKTAKQGWVAETWSFTPVEYGGKWVFDPVASPDPDNYKNEPAKMHYGKRNNQ